MTSSIDNREDTERLSTPQEPGIPERDFLRHCISPASFWWPNYLESSAWLDHGPFAFWLIDAHRPRTVVELGTHGGFSYFAFCQAVQTLGTNTRCYAVDHWKGDEHAGFYDESIYERVKSYNETHYANFSRLVRSSFDDALQHFSDGSIDLLHIDGRHFYEDVKHDFESWLPKLSDRAVVILHDTNVRERNFGVFRLWEEIRNEYPNFEFLHGHGLGVLGYGKDLSSALRALFTAASDSQATVAVRDAYNRLGAYPKQAFHRRAEKRRADEKKIELHETLSARQRDLKALSAKLAQQKEDLNTLSSELSERQRTIRSLRNSTSWRLTSPLRALSKGFKSATRIILRVLRLVWWIMTGQLSRAAKASLPYYRRYVPLLVKRTIRRPLRRAFRRWLPKAAEQNEYEGRGTDVASKKKNSDVPTERPLAYRQLMTESLFKPLRRAPYSSREEYLFAYMNAYGRHLENKYISRPQSKLVSVIMPTFNRADCIMEAIGSLLDQTYTNWELIVVDDFGTDGTQELFKQIDDERIKYTRLSSNLGSAGARNVALKKAVGDYVAYLDSDNTIERNFLLVMVNALEDHQSVDAAYCAQRAFRVRGGNTEEEHVRFAPYHRPSLENSNYIDIGVVVHRAWLIDCVGFFNEKMQRLADWEFILRLGERKAALAVPVILSNYYYDKVNNQNTKVHGLDAPLKEIAKTVRGEAVGRKLARQDARCVEEMYSLGYKRELDSDARNVSIVIPSYEALECLRACVGAVKEFSEPSAVELIIVDNGSGKEVVTYLRTLESEGTAKVILNSANLGFTHAVNQGIAAACDGRDIVLLNNDAIVTEGWLAAFHELLGHHPDAGLIVPRQVVPASEPSVKKHQPFRNSNRECDINISAHHGNLLDPMFDLKNGYMELRYAPFFCVYIPNSTLSGVGPLDVESGPHYRSDRIYCDMVREVLNKKILYTPHSKVYHLVQQSTKILRTLDKEKFDALFVRNNWDQVVRTDLPRVIDGAVSEGTHMEAESPSDSMGRGGDGRSNCSSLQEDVDTAHGLPVRGAGIRWFLVVDGDPNSGKSSCCRSLGRLDGVLHISTDNLIHRELVPGLDVSAIRRTKSGKVNLEEFVKSEVFDLDMLVDCLRAEIIEKVHQCPDVSVVVLDGFVFKAHPNLVDRVGVPKQRRHVLRARNVRGRYLVGDVDVTSQNYEDVLTHVLK
ncbi:glycosyltransferase [Thioalkalivibrio sp. ARh3]|uniref:glycosyltransferase n=1 Tax=Thioalkalivibrio sp. ARh3 TaxID=1158148 RepID=UPI00039FC42E|nr:glycosyltransferase [Thioalkalivibrio sp. ARh3]